MNSKNYITPTGHQRIKDELLHLLDIDRPEIVKIVHWAASNGDRSENGDYIYGKKRLREIDRRIRFLNKRLEFAEVVDPATRDSTDQIFFGATVSYLDGAGQRQQLSIVGVDEIGQSDGFVSWISPIATAMLKKRIGDEIEFHTPNGLEILEILDVEYKAL
jgi:transcription elongation factor GreB